MFSDHVRVPRPGQHESGMAFQPLPESLRFQAIHEGYDASDKSYDDSVQAAYAVAGLVREVVTFSDHTADQPELSPDWICSSHTTNCHGHSIIVSECLEQIGVPHRVGFANLHSFLLLEDPESGRANLIDTPVEKLCTDITPALGGIALHQISREQGGANYIWGNIILYRSQFENKQRALERRPWLSFLAKNEGPSFITDDMQDLESRLILRTYEPDIGRGVLLAYDSFMHAMLRKDIARAHEWAQALDGTYPDIDKRNKLRAPTRLVRSLGSTALVEEALHDINVIEHSFRPFSEDLNLALWPIDERRDLGARIGDSVMINGAIDEYEQIYQQRKVAGLSTIGVENRIRKAKSRLSRITH